MFLQTPTDSDATARLFKSDLEQRGFVMNLTRAWAWRPEVAEGFSALRDLLTTRSTVTGRELAVLVSATAATLGDSYCSLAWGQKLAAATDASTAAAVLKGTGSDELTARERALAAWARKVVDNPSATEAADVDESARPASPTKRSSRRPPSSRSALPSPPSTTLSASDPTGSLPPRRRRR